MLYLHKIHWSSEDGYTAILRETKDGEFLVTFSHPEPQPLRTLVASVLHTCGEFTSKARQAFDAAERHARTRPGDPFTFKAESQYVVRVGSKYVQTAIGKASVMTTNRIAAFHWFHRDLAEATARSINHEHQGNTLAIVEPVPEPSQSA